MQISVDCMWSNLLQWSKSARGCSTPKILQLGKLTLTTSPSNCNVCHLIFYLYHMGNSQMRQTWPCFSFGPGQLWPNKPIRWASVSLSTSKPLLYILSFPISTKFMIWSQSSGSALLRMMSSIIIKLVVLILLISFKFRVLSLRS